MEEKIEEQNWRTCSACETVEAEQPIFVAPSFQHLIDKLKTESANDKQKLKDYQALLRQVEFSNEEKYFAQYETADPLGENKHCITPYLVHQYENRVLLLTTGKCVSYCRYCFRRGFTARGRGSITNEELKIVCNYIKEHPAVTEILVSGGDPMTCSFEKLKTILTSLRKIRTNLIIRLCTRGPIFAPELFTQQLVDLLKNCRPLWLIPHINHPAELGADQMQAITNCINSGIPVQSQTVLLKGVNDDAQTLITLFHTLTCMGVKPGYIFQLDPAAGTSHFRVPLKEALELWKILEKKLSGLSRPQFVADLPNGGGKFPLSALISAEKIIKTNDDASFSAIGYDELIYDYNI